MTAMGSLAGGRHVLRVQRRQHAIVRAGRPRDEHTGLVQALGLAAFLAVRAAAPAWVVYAAWKKAEATSELSSVRWGIASVLGVVIASGHLFQSSALSFAPREVLFLPDKASVLLARLLRALPVLLWIGGAWATASWLCLRQEWPRQPVAVAAACATAALAPFARTVAVLLQRLAAPEAGSVLTPVVLVALCAAYLMGPAHWTGDIERVVLTWTVLVLALPPLAGLVHGLWKATRASLRELWLDVVRAPRTIVLVALVAPPAVWRERPWLPVAAWLGAASLCVLLPIALRGVLRRVNGAEAEPRGGAEEGVGEHSRDTRVSRPAARAVHRGRSPWRATWRLHWLRHGFTWRDLRRPWRPLRFLARMGFGVAVTALTVWVGDSSMPWVFLVAAVLVPVSAAAVSRERLRLLGLDLREQARHGMTLALCTVAAPCLLVGALVAAVSGWTEQRALILAALAAVFLMRIGWRGLFPRPESASENGASLVAGLLVATSWVVSLLLPVVQSTSELRTRTGLVQWPTVVGVAAIAIVGLVRRIVLWREVDLLADLIAARERSRPAARTRDEGGSE